MNALISEFQPNPAGSDPATQMIEISGTPGETFSGWLLSIESDAGSSAGTVDRASQVSGTFDSSGLLTVEVNDLENPSFTLVLVDEFTGSVGDDFDLDNDGTPDLDPASVGITVIYDAIGIPDNTDDEAIVYGAELGGVDFSFTGEEPQRVFRSDSTGDLFAVNVIGDTQVFDTNGTAIDISEFSENPADGTNFGEINATFVVAESAFTLELLHFTDQEANAATIDNIDNLSAVLNALRDEDLGDDGLADNTLTLSSGDAIIPGLFFDASEAVFGSQGIADIQIQNELGVQAIALGNHEFDLGTGLLAGLIDGSAPGDFSALTSGTALDGQDFTGAAFPYLSANLDFSTDPNLAPLEAAGGQDAATLSNVVTSSVVSEVNGELIGIVGATVPTIRSISSPGADLGISPDWASGTPTSEELDALAEILQTEVNQLLADNPEMDKVVLLSHMQQISIEQELASRLENVDIIVAGGSNTRLFDDNDRIRDGDSDQGQYPQFIENAGGTTTAVVNTDGNYKYVGRLVIDFDEDGNIIPSSYDETVSGAYATDDQGVADLNAENLVDPEIDAITDAIQAQIVATESNVFGVSNVFLNGNRSGTFAADDPDGVRTQETNLGNLTADANLEYAQGFDETVVVSIKNGGGIRANIGEIVVPAGGTEAVRQPNSAVLDENGVEVKPEGGISQNDIATTLAFNNGLTLLDMTRQELKDFLEGSISALPTGVSGGFPQLSGLKFSFDETQTSQTYDVDGNILIAGERVINAGIFDENGELIAEIVRDGEVVGDSSETFRVVTLNFLANAGDEILSNLSNPNRVDLIDLDSDGVNDGLFTGDATFATDGSEQDALAEYLDDNFPDADNAFDQADVGPEGDLRIQNLSFTEDTIFDDGPDLEPTPVATGDVLFEQVAIFQGEGEEPGDVNGAAESVAHEDGKLYVTNGEQDRIDVFTIPETAGAEPEPADAIDLSGLDGYDGVQSVAVENGVVAVAISRAPTETTVFGETVLQSEPGFVALFSTDTLELLSTIDVGNLPDQLTFNEDGTQLLVAGEGEKNGDSDNDDNPLGTVAVIDTTDPTAPTAEILDFTQFNGFEDLARDAGIRIQEGVSFAEDVEPEYIAISPDGTTAFVSLQENNAIAKIDLGSNEIVDVFSLGTVDFSGESALDADDNGEINITNFDNLVGFRMADAITSFEVSGQTFIATANEGDSRDFDEDRVGDLVDEGLIDPSVDTTGLERLEVSTTDGDTDGDGDIDVLHTFSSRSFSIFDADGNLVFDSGSQFEQIIADLAPERFNDDDGDNGEDRSDAKGPEPEAIAVGEVGGRLYAFIGLERDSGIMLYDISDPENAFFVNYIPPLHVDNAADGEPALHSPEVIAFISEEESGTGNSQIAISYEVSGTTAVYDLTSINPIVTIPEIQGEGHVSKFEGRTVTTTGIVTAVDTNGYYLQDAEGDGNDATSDGIFIFTGGAPSVLVGDEVTVSGNVSEFIPGGAGTGNLSITQISANTEEVLSSGNTVEAVVLGANGRAIPTEVVISPDETPVNLQDDPGEFNPETDGIDFFESLEGMLVTVDNPVAISATNRFGETWVAADDGANTTPGLNDRGGLNLNADADGLGDLNPERIQIQYDSGLLPEGFTRPDLNVGDDLSDVTGVVGYGFGNFEINVTEAFSVEEATSNEAEVTEIAGSESDLTVATYNVLNVTSNEADGDADQIAQLAQQIVNNLGSPDILALQEIQDNSGVTDDGTLDADETLQAIVDAIAAAGGPVYSFQSAVVDEDGENGGVPGGNIRNAFLYNEERVEADSFLTLESNVLTDMGVTNPDAFEGSRDPLLGVFTFNGQEITLINNHFSSRFGSEPIFGGPQPFNQGGEDEREAQALTINEVVDGLLASDPDANVAVLGDLNTFDFTDELTEDLPGVGDDQVLTNLINYAEGDEAYSFNFQGNSQALDHIFVTDNLLDGAEVDFVHVNVDFADAASDHEPIVASFTLEAPETEDLILVGTRKRDILNGESGDDLILGQRGRDILNGNDGDDVIFGGNARDEINGGEGDDNLFGGNGRDEIFGGEGNDLIDGGQGRDKLDGGEGDDVFININRGDTFHFSGDFGDDQVYGDNVDIDQFQFANVDADDITVEDIDGGRVVTVNGGDTFGTVTILGGEFDDNGLLVG